MVSEAFSLEINPADRKVIISFSLVCIVFWSNDSHDPESVKFTLKLGKTKLYQYQPSLLHSKRKYTPYGI